MHVVPVSSIPQTWAPIQKVQVPFSLQGAPLWMNSYKLPEKEPERDWPGRNPLWEETHDYRRGFWHSGSH